MIVIVHCYDKNVRAYNFIFSFFFLILYFDKYCMVLMFDIDLFILDAFAVFIINFICTYITDLIYKNIHINTYI